MSQSEFPMWRRLHFGASSVVALIGALHVGVAPFLYRHWAPDAVWFVGTGLGLLFIGLLNLAQLQAGPAWDHTARITRWTNYAFAIFGIAAVVAVPKAEAVALLSGLILEALASHWTLPGPV